MVDFSARIQSRSEKNIVQTAIYKAIQEFNNSLGMQNIKFEDEKTAKGYFFLKAQQYLYDNTNILPTLKYNDYYYPHIETYISTGAPGEKKISWKEVWGKIHGWVTIIGGGSALVGALWLILWIV